MSKKVLPVSNSRPPLEQYFFRLVYLGSHVLGASLVRMVDHQDSSMRVLQ